MSPYQTLNPMASYSWAPWSLKNRRNRLQLLKSSEKHMCIWFLQLKPTELASTSSLILCNSLCFSWHCSLHWNYLCLFPYPVLSHFVKSWHGIFADVFRYLTHTGWYSMKPCNWSPTRNIRRLILWDNIFFQTLGALCTRCTSFLSCFKGCWKLIFDTGTWMLSTKVLARDLAVPQQWCLHHGDIVRLSTTQMTDLALRLGWSSCSFSICSSLYVTITLKLSSHYNHNQDIWSNSQHLFSLKVNRSFSDDGW